MERFYFTFGLAHEHCDCYQTILASDEYTACKKMFEIHGRQWSAQYTEAQWRKALADGHFYRLKPLQEVEVK